MEISEKENASISHDDRTYATFAHLGGLFFSFIAPLVIRLVMKEKSSFVDKQGKEALNFQITLMIFYAVALVLLLY